MGERASYAPGTFSWTDLGTTDAEGAKAFYTSLFGWQADDMPAGEAAVYTMLRKDGKDVAALYELREEQRAQGVPPHWLSYVTVEDVDAAAARARELGATVVAEPFDVLDVGRMALVQDPQGAMFALWQAGRHIGASLVNAPGALSWNELATSDIDAAARFYGALFGWRMEAMPGAEPPYVLIGNGDALNGGMMALTPQHGDAPPHWAVYFGVDDVDAAVRAVEAGGGRVLVPPTDIPVGRIAFARDPQGAVFAVYSGLLEP